MQSLERGRRRGGQPLPGRRECGGIAGYGAAAAVPAAIKQAMLLLIGHWFANREAVNVGNIVTAMPLAVEALIAPYRRVGV